MEAFLVFDQLNLAYNKLLAVSPLAVVQHLP